MVRSNDRGVRGVLSERPLIPLLQRPPRHDALDLLGRPIPFLGPTERAAMTSAETLIPRLRTVAAVMDIVTATAQACAAVMAIPHGFCSVLSSHLPEFSSDVNTSLH